MQLLVTTFILLSALFVYWDASSHKIGKIEGDKGFFNLSAGTWSAMTVLLWIITFPSYLIKRKGLIEKAITNPCEASWRPLKMGFLGFLALSTLVAAINPPKSSRSISSVETIEAGFGDFQFNQKKILNKRIKMEGLFMLTNGREIVTTQTGTNPIAISFEKFTNDQKAKIYNNCNGACPATFTGIPQVRNGLIVIVLDQIL